MQVQLLRMIPPTHPELKTPLLNRLLASSDPVLRREVVQTLALSDKPDREVVLDKLVTSAETPEPLKAIALGGLSGISKNHPRFLRLLDSESSLLKQESLRALTGTPLPAAEKERIEAIAAQDTIHSPLAARVLGRPQTSSRPNKNDLTAWLDRFGTGGEPDAGRRIFFHPQLAGCYRCHQIDGRGAVAGPDLSSIGREQPRRILESLLQPDATVAPHYQAWTLVTTDGKTHTGILIHTYLDEYTYLNAQGQPFKLKTNDISGRTASPHSIMPADLVDQLTDQELRDLLAFLFTRK